MCVCVSVCVCMRVCVFMSCNESVDFPSPLHMGARCYGNRRV